MQKFPAHSLLSSPGEPGITKIRIEHFPIRRKLLLVAECVTEHPLPSDLLFSYQGSLDWDYLKDFLSDVYLSTNCKFQRVFGRQKLKFFYFFLKIISVLHFHQNSWIFLLMLYALHQTRCFCSFHTYSQSAYAFSVPSKPFSISPFVFPSIHSSAVQPSAPD